MKLVKQLLTKNDCYKTGKTITPKGVMVHSTGANNPKVSRYVPGNDEIGWNTGGNHWNQPRQYVYTDGTSTTGYRDYSKKLKSTKYSACVHAFVGKVADGAVCAVQTLPWSMRGWHCAGDANETHISFEICEDGLEDVSYFEAVYRQAVELTAYLCRQFALDPLADGVVICHSEGHARGVASNHGDVMHWFPKFGKNMDGFRADVSRELKGDDEEVTQEQFNQMMEVYLSQRNAKPADDWAKPYIQDAIDAGSMTDVGGTIERPQGFITRQEMAVVAAALSKK